MFQFKILRYHEDYYYPNATDRDDSSISGANCNDARVHDLATGDVTARVFLEQQVKNSTASRRLN